MKLYDFAKAPSPRRVRIFLAEKGVQVPMQQIDLRAGEQFSDDYCAINPQCEVPFLVLDDGTGIGEVNAICRYFEASHPEPALFGRGAKEQALVAMWDHRVEKEGLSSIRDVLRNSLPAFEGRALPGRAKVPQIADLAERGRSCLLQFFEDMDGRLADCAYLAGDSFSIADITGQVCVDFAGWVKIGIPEEHKQLSRWYQSVSARPSAKA